MNLESYKRWYVLEDAFWYIPKMKQFNENTILEFSDRLDKCSLEKKNKINLKDLREIINDLNIES